MAAGDSIAEIETDKVSQNLLDVLKNSMQCGQAIVPCIHQGTQHRMPQIAIFRRLNGLGEQGHLVHCKAPGRGWRQGHVC